MPFRPPLADHPRLGALFSVLVGLLVFGGLLPLINHEPPRWPVAIGTSVLIGLFTYLARTRSARFLSYTLIGVSVVALIVYGAITWTQGIPQDGHERLAWAGVIAIPVCGLALAWWILQRPRTSQ